MTNFPLVCILNLRVFSNCDAVDVYNAYHTCKKYQYYVCLFLECIKCYPALNRAVVECNLKILLVSNLEILADIFLTSHRIIEVGWSDVLSIIIWLME